MAGHQNRAANVAAWHQMRAEQAAEAEARREQRAAEKAARREANRAAWWGAKGLQTPSAPNREEQTEDLEPKPDELRVKRCEVEQASATEWHVVSNDGVGYEVEAKGFDVTIDGETFTMPTMQAVRELIELAEETRREEADMVASFEPGMRLESNGVAYEVEKATSAGVTIRTEAAGACKRQTLKVRRCARGQFVKLHANSKSERVIYAADIAA